MAVSSAGRAARMAPDRQTVLIACGTAVVALGLGIALGSAHDAFQFLGIGGAAVFVCLLLTWQDELIAALAVATSILVDVYHPFSVPIVGVPFPAVATVLVGLVLLRQYFQQSPAHPWLRTPYLWVWAPLLLLAAIAIHTSGDATSATEYFVTVLVMMPLAYMLGTQMGRGAKRLSRFLIALSAFAVLISLHGIIQAQFGNFLFLTPQWNADLATQGYYIIAGTDKMRATSFLVNPDKFGEFTATMLPILLGLGVALEAVWAKVAAFAGAALVAVALLLSYSTASFIAIAVGMLAAFLLIASGWARLYLPVVVALLAIALAVLFPSSVQVLQAHATASVEITERVGAWLTGLGTIAHYPLTGVGLGYSNYWLRSQPFLSPLEVLQVDDPQNSFLELAAMAGIAVALFYLLALGLSFAAAARNYLRAGDDDRKLIGAVLVSLIVLTVNSFATPGWTYPAFGLMGWLLLGAIASPALLAPPAPEATTGHEAVGDEAVTRVTTAPALATVTAPDGGT